MRSIRRPRQKLIHDLEARTGCDPDLVGLFAGALVYTQYGWMKRRIMRAIARKEGGHTDLTRDYEYTDWAAVDQFAYDMGTFVRTTRAVELCARCNAVDVVSATADVPLAAETRVDVPSSLVVLLDGTEFGLRGLTVAALLAAVFGADLVVVTADPGCDRTDDTGVARGAGERNGPALGDHRGTHRRPRARRFRPRRGPHPESPCA